MHEMDDFESLLIEYGQMPCGSALKGLYDLNEIKGKEKKGNKPGIIDFFQIWSWA